MHLVHCALGYPMHPQRSLHSYMVLEPLSMASIADQLQSYRSALEAAQSKGDGATIRKLEQTIRDLEAFSQRHPDATAAPSPLEVFCDLNPSDVNCLVYDD
jgi:hypothetical protein